MNSCYRSPVERRKERRGGTRGGGGSGGKGSFRRVPPERRIFVSNLPFEMKWQEVKDLFREEVGDVAYVEMFNDEDGKSRGCGIMEFDSEEIAKKAVEKMHRYELKGRLLVVKEDFDLERDKCGRIIGGSNRRERDRRRNDLGVGSGSGCGSGSSGGNLSRFGSNTYGLSPQFLDSLGIDGPLHCRLFVANLAYTVDERKLREVFRLAGRVVTVELNRDKDGKSRGHATIEYDHPVEAVQAISMFHDQSLMDRKMMVRYDKQPGPSPQELNQLPSCLPEGLAGVGVGLGSGGNPLTDVSRNLPTANQSQPQTQSSAPAMNNSGALGIGGLGVAELSTLAVLARQLGASNMGNMGGILGNLGATSNTGMALGNMAGGPQGNMVGASPGNMGSGPQGNMGNGPQGNMGSGPQGNMGGGSQGNVGGPVLNSGNLGGGSGGGGGTGMDSGPTGMGSGGVGSMGNGHMSGISRGGSSGYNTASSVSFGGSGGMNQVSGPMGGIDLGDMGRLGSSGRSQSSTMRSDCIMVRNLPLDCNWAILHDGFAHCGDIKYAEIKERGTGLIRFNNEKAAERAVSMMDRQSIAGRTIDVRLF